ncbi:MAG: DUF2203 domain-containing protein [Proteobacteria bacterium]|nr:DUF2203 domain-containing protein [Pseudomonadota bacterium]
MKRRYFTVEQATALVPALEQAFGRVLQIRVQIKLLARRFDGEQRLLAEGDDATLSPALFRARATAKGLIELLAEEVEGIERLGCVVKDLDQGLVDWYARQDGREVLLCWRLGEKRVGHWHELEDGFAGRRALTGR